MQRIGETSQRVYVMRVYRDRPSVTFNRLIGTIEQAQNLPEIVVRLHKIRRQCDGASITVHSLLQLTGGTQRIPEIVVHSGEFWLLDQPVPIDCDRWLDLAIGIKCVAVIVQRPRVVRLDCQCPAIIIDGHIMVLLRRFGCREFVERGDHAGGIRRTDPHGGCQDIGGIRESTLPAAHLAEQAKHLKVARCLMEDRAAAGRRFGQPTFVEMLQGSLVHDQPHNPRAIA